MAVIRMLASFAWVCATIIAGLAVAVPTPSGTGAGGAPIEAITGLSLPLLEGEGLVRLADGCHMIVDPGIKPHASAAQSRWFGACRFGLINGKGFLLHDTPGSKPFPWAARMGRGVKNAGGREHFARNAMRDTDLTVEFHGTPEGARAAARSASPLPESIIGDRSWFVSLAYLARRNDRDDLVETVHVGSSPCPMPLSGTSMVEQLKWVDATPEHMRILIPYCEAAQARLKREGRRWDPVPFAPGPFEAVDYGYYYYVTIARSIQKGVPAREWNTQKYICPAPGDVASCEAVWRPVVQPYLIARDAERKREAELQDRREKIIASLEAAFAEKRKLVAAKASPRRP